MKNFLHRVLNITCMACVATAMVSCKSSGAAKAEATGADAPALEVPAFSTDSAMSYLKAQTDLGPRVPGTKAHKECGDYLVERLTTWGADTVIEQNVTVKAWNGDELPLRNILARFNSDAPGDPILLLAHWDSRPWADAETDATKAKQPIDGANDGASGVAVLMEIARMAGEHGSIMPVDILLVDGEDYGSPGNSGGDETTWCLGTQAWLETSPYNNSRRPRYAILLDMVGGKGARFHREVVSNAYARDIVDMVWSTAASIGLGDRFVNTQGGAVVDDHLFINRYGIPAIDIIENYNESTGSFNPTWHTHDDTYENIDPSTISDTGRLISYLTIKRK
ncbi:MAG: M28 family peptidase [Bacteroidales bacterium]|nr:M28 family peptidase [Bacteroidales bacterium]